MNIKSNGPNKIANNVCRDRVYFTVAHTPIFSLHYEIHPSLILGRCCNLPALVSKESDHFRELSLSVKQGSVPFMQRCLNLQCEQPNTSSP
jgi:hypothetical protein